MPPFIYIQSQKLVNSVMIALEKEAKEILDAGKIRIKEYDVEPETLFLKEEVTYVLL